MTSDSAVASADLDPDALVETVDDEKLGHGGTVEAQPGGRADLAGRPRATRAGSCFVVIVLAPLWPRFYGVDAASTTIGPTPATPASPVADPQTGTDLRFPNIGGGQAPFGTVGPGDR
ncbi:MAG TPA: hypothetical protein VH637_11320, partial [Streptosporangiaceae bacterium]|jgi:hypothetical protein